MGDYSKQGCKDREKFQRLMDKEHPSANTITVF